SLDFSKTYQDMLTAQTKLNQERAERAKKQPAAKRRPNDDKPRDAFGEFEKKAGFKIRDELLPVLGNEVAVAGSLQSMQGLGVMVGGPAAAASPSPSPSPSGSSATSAQKPPDKFTSPVLVVSIRDREAARRLMPLVLDGLGAGAANLIASPERREDT